MGWWDVSEGVGERYVRLGRIAENAIGMMKGVMVRRIFGSCSMYRIITSGIWVWYAV